MKVVIALDLGTTGNRAIAFDQKGKVIAQSYYEFPQLFPKPGWVEHDPWAIWKTSLKALQNVLSKVSAKNVEAIGITNQRETTVLWDKKSGQPVYPAIVWQDRRTANVCQKLKPHEKDIRRRTGLSVDPYFSSTKIQWILKHVPGVRQLAEQGRIAFGTIDTWILWNLSGRRIHATDPSNASRTMCFNIRTLEYDPVLLELFNIPENIFPQVKESASLFGVTEKQVCGASIPITGILGDQQAALFAQGGWRNGVLKNTYGTGLFLMTSTGTSLPHAGKLINTIAWKWNHSVTYAMEGSVFVGGSCIQWLRDGIHLLDSAPASEKMASQLKSNEGVYFVPALAGLGAPYWDPDARGTLVGLTRGTTKNHLARAALEAMAYQTRDVVEEMKKIFPKTSFKTLCVDGGAVKNNFLMQFQADILGIQVERPVMTETTAFGAAGIAGIAANFWTQKEFLEARKIERVFKVRMPDKEKEYYYRQWQRAVERSLKWHQE
jgi:glycerol kinase